MGFCANSHTQLAPLLTGSLLSGSVATDLECKSCENYDACRHPTAVSAIENAVYMHPMRTHTQTLLTLT
eukprot:2909049-Amphidinium_carterae.1